MKIYNDVEEFIKALKEGDEMMSTYNFIGDGFEYFCGDLPTYKYVEGEPKKLKMCHPVLSGCVEVYGFERNAEAVRDACDRYADIEIQVYRAEDDKIFYFYRGEPSDLSWWEA